MHNTVVTIVPSTGALETGGRFNFNFFQAHSVKTFIGKRHSTKRRLNPAKEHCCIRSRRVYAGTHARRRRPERKMVHDCRSLTQGALTTTTSAGSYRRRLGSGTRSLHSTRCAHTIRSRSVLERREGVSRRAETNPEVQSSKARSEHGLVSKETLIHYPHTHTHTYLST